MTFSYLENESSAKIKVIGVGGAGGNAVNNMIDSNLQGVKFIVANTDAQALNNSKAEKKIQLGAQLTEGLGAGADPEIGKDAAMENIEEIRDALDGSHMVFITAGFGGGTGTGAAPVIAEICKDLGVLTVAVVSKPFSFEGKKRDKQALEGVESLRGITDTVITIPNDRLRGIAPKGARMLDMFVKADEILHHSVKGITDLIIMPGLVNLDFADVRTTMRKAGMALMGIGIASGENRAIEAAERAISHPLLEDISISGAKGVLMNITSSSDLTLDEMTEASDRIHQEVGDDAEIIWGQTIDDNLGEEMRITVIATGIGQEEQVQDNIHHFEPAPRRKKESAPAGGQKQGMARGHVRTPTEDELQNWDDYEEPVVVQRKKAVGEDMSASFSKSSFDGDDLEIPTFLRRKAD
ncbi:MAG: cell division protein FtsZ [Thermodesulfobacteriota bacterium]